MALSQTISLYWLMAEDTMESNEHIRKTANTMGIMQSTTRFSLHKQHAVSPFLVKLLKTALAGLKYKCRLRSTKLRLPE